MGGPQTDEMEVNRPGSVVVTNTEDATDAPVPNDAIDGASNPAGSGDDGAKPPVVLGPKVASLPTEANSACDTALLLATGSTCKNGGVCSFRRADCTDVDAPFDTPVCSCGAPTGGACFYGQFCDNKVDSCPDDTTMCNIVKNVKAGVDPVPKVCSSEAWPKRLCIEDAPAVADASSTLWDEDVAPPAAATSTNAGGAVAGVMIVGLLLAMAIFYKKRVLDGQDVDELKINAVNSAALNPMYSDVGNFEGKSNPMYGEVGDADDNGEYLQPTALTGTNDGMYDLAGATQEGYLAVGDDADEPTYDLSTMGKGAAMEPMYDMSTMGKGAAIEGMYDTATLEKGAAMEPMYDAATGGDTAEAMYDVAGSGDTFDAGDEGMYDFGNAIDEDEVAPAPKKVKKAAVKKKASVKKLSAEKINAHATKGAGKETEAARAARALMENGLNQKDSHTFKLEKKLRAVNDTTLDKSGSANIGARIAAQASIKADAAPAKKEGGSFFGRKGSIFGSKKKAGSTKKVEKKESVKPRKKSSPLLAVVMGADPDYTQSITINPGEV